jgi:hypothetical protein
VQAALPRLHSSSQTSLVRGLQTSVPAAAEVVVPAMGDSITEGSIAALLKQPGASSTAVCSSVAARLGLSQRCIVACVLAA